GGDFYEVWEAPGGCWIALGDVSGKGPGAVDLNVLARHTIRTAAMRDDRPGAVLRTLNEAVLGREAGERYCTAVVCRMRIDGEGAAERMAEAVEAAVRRFRPGGELLDDVALVVARLTGLDRVRAEEAAPAASPAAAPPAAPG